MSIATAQTIQVLQVVLQTVPIGTNLGLLHLLWSILNGSFLSSRGALFPGLQLAGFAAAASRRSWAALRYGVWRIDDLLHRWRSYVQDEGQWEAHVYDGYRPVAVDITAFWRPHLRGWPGRYFNGIIGRLFGGIGFALVAEVGQVDGHRLPLLRTIIRAHPQDMSESTLKETALTWTSHHLAEDEIAVHDAGAYISDMQAAGVPRYLLRLASNCTGRRNFLPLTREDGHGNTAISSDRCHGNATASPSSPPRRISKPPLSIKDAPFAFTAGGTWSCPRTKWLTIMRPLTSWSFSTRSMKTHSSWAPTWT